MSKTAFGIILAACFLFGGALGYAAFFAFADLFLIESATPYTLVADNAAQLQRARIEFAVLLGLAFATAPLAALIGSRGSLCAPYKLAVPIYLSISIIAMLVAMAYYKNLFSRLSGKWILIPPSR